MPLSHLSCVLQDEAGPYLALEAHAEALGGVASDSVYLDVFSLGAIAYLLFTGQPPAASDLELQDKLSRGKGLQVTDAINGAGSELQDLIQYATHPDIGSRYHPRAPSSASAHSRRRTPWPPSAIIAYCVSPSPPRKAPRSRAGPSSIPTRLYLFRYSRPHGRT